MSGKKNTFKMLGICALNVFNKNLKSFFFLSADIGFTFENFVHSEIYVILALKCSQFAI